MIGAKADNTCVFDGTKLIPNDEVGWITHHTRGQRRAKSIGGGIEAPSFKGPVLPVSRLLQWLVSVFSHPMGMQASWIGQ
ncbi:unnamed protein product [Protopolystoma xenopodis]|uniref:Uncharacterized protein n=1 Tax=Protopolystoma xenopodis TaxID=117903 RepID=A0A3S5B544_9PLAT|nr:unnamed protein product [Protopolystoma xenopodis]